jgi:hypothetical protein
MLISVDLPAPLPEQAEDRTAWHREVDPLERLLGRRPLQAAVGLAQTQDLHRERRRPVAQGYLVQTLGIEHRRLAVEALAILIHSRSRSPCPVPGMSADAPTPRAGVIAGATAAGKFSCLRMAPADCAGAKTGGRDGAVILQ